MYELGEVVAQKATKLFKSPILLEFEKVYSPLILFKKKNYIGKMYEPPNVDTYKLDSKGIVLTRRDNPNLTKQVYSGIVDIIMSQGKDGLKPALQFLDMKIKEILND